MAISFFPLPMMIGLAGLGILLLILRSKKYSLAYCFKFGVFWVYMLIVLGITLFPLVLPLPDDPGQPLQDILRRVNLVPFFLRSSFPDHFLLRREMIANILLTIPFGFLLPMIVRINVQKFFWIALGLGLGIELTQFSLSLISGGGHGRVTDVNDVIFNFTGAMIGYAIFGFLHWIVPGLQRQKT